MTILAESAALLVISGDTLDPEAVTEQLCACPHRAAHKGETLTLPGGGQRIAETGRWERSAPTRQPGNPDAQIIEVFAALSDDANTWAAIASTCTIDLSLRLFLDRPDETFALTPQALAILAARHVALTVDIVAPYAPSNSCGG